MIAGVRPSQGNRRRWIAAVIVVIVVLAGTGITAYWVLVPEGAGHSSDSNLGNGLTFNQAFGIVNETLASRSDGPWQPTSVLGIAGEVLAAPVPYYLTSLNLTLRLCGELPGVTVWNSSGVPLFTGSLNSGAAPFWSFVFKSASGSYLYATNLEGAVRVDGPSSTFTNCLEAAGIGSNYTVNPSVDTPSVAQLAYSKGGESYYSKHHPLVEYYVLGNAQIAGPDASPFGWIVNYFRCDLVGVSGLQNYTAVGVLTSANGSVAFVDNGWITCTLPNYLVDFGPISRNSTTTFGSTSDLSVPFQVTLPGVLKNNRTFYDGWGLLTWMTQPNLIGSGGQPLPISPAYCESWVPSLSDCPANSSGWFAVLLSQNSAWLDSYPSSTNSSAWAIPNVIVSSQDQLVLVCPSSWNLTADNLTITGTQSAPPVTGFTTL